MSIFDKIVDGKIYKLSSGNYDKFYIGCTTVSLEERLNKHIESYEEWLTSNFETSYLSSFEILKYVDYRIELIEDCPQIIGWSLLKREQYYQKINYKDIVNINISGKGVNDNYILADTKDIYTCSCGAIMTNYYKIRKTHSLSNMHRKKIREIHIQMVSNNPNFEIIEIEQKPIEIIYENEGITLNINY
jgi:hypothetical protein